MESQTAFAHLLGKKLITFLPIVPVELLKRGPLQKESPGANAMICLVLPGPLIYWLSTQDSVNNYPMLSCSTQTGLHPAHCLQADSEKSGPGPYPQIIPKETKVQ